MIVIDHKQAEILYCLNNKLVREFIRTREQSIAIISDRYSISALDYLDNLIAVGDYSGQVQVLRKDGFVKVADLKYHKLKVISMKFIDVN